VTGDPLRSALRETERRFLAAHASVAARGTPTVLSEYLTLMAEVGVIDERLEEASSQRDASYMAARRVRSLRDYSRWLARRVSTEFLLLLEAHLETELKRLIGPDAYELFLRFEEVEEAAHEIGALSDDDLMARAREGTVFRRILNRVRVWELPARPQELTPES
jgi:hypothetical protein